MIRRKYDTVTHMPVLIPCGVEEGEGEATFLGANPLGESRPVRVFTDADLNPGLLTKTMGFGELKVVTALLELSQALQKKDQLAINNARADLLRATAHQENFTPDPQLMRDLISDGIKASEVEDWALELSFARLGEEDEKYMLSSRLSDALAPVRIVLWWTGKRFSPALYCPEPKTALYTYVLTGVSTKGGLGLCPFCGNLFRKDRLDQSYCCAAHREAHRVARWRAAKAAKSKRAKKVGKSRTRKRV
jgi:hypothetical protein